jgi:transposase
MGGNPFLMPRSNASSKAKGAHAWKEMMLFRERHPEEFERRHHKKSNAESTNASLKGKHGESLRSGRWRLQKREVGLRVIARNLRRLIRCRVRQEVELLDQADFSEFSIWILAIDCDSP